MPPYKREYQNFLRESLVRVYSKKLLHLHSKKEPFLCPVMADGMRTVLIVCFMPALRTQRNHICSNLVYSAYYMCFEKSKDLAIHYLAFPIFFYFLICILYILVVSSLGASTFPADNSLNELCQSNHTP